MANGKGGNGAAFPQARDSTSISYQNSQEEDTPLVVVGMGAAPAQHETSGSSSSSSALEMEFDGGRSCCWSGRGERGRRGVVVN